MVSIINEQECTLCENEKCFCQNFWNTFEDDLLDIKLPKNDELESTQIKPSTITVCFDIGTKINIKNVVDTFNTNFDNHDIFQKIKYKEGTKKSKKKELNDAFYNQCSMVLSITDNESKIQNQTSKINIFIFPNGSFRTVGCRTIKTVTIMINEIFCFFKYNNGLVLDKDKLSLNNIRITMINSDFKLNRKIKQKKLFDIICNEYTIENDGNIKSCLYDPDKYPGINIKFLKDVSKIDSSKSYTRKGRKKIDGEVSVLIFRSGSIIITGYKKPIEAKYAYEYINQILLKHSDIVLYKKTS